MSATNDLRAWAAQPSAWPQWPYLPIKRIIGENQAPDTAVLYAGRTQEEHERGIAKIIRVNIWAPSTEWPETPEEVQLDQLIAEGWVVD